MLFTVSDTDTIENIYFRNATFQEDALAEWQATRTGFLTAGAANQLGFLRIPEDVGIVEGEPCAGNETAHYEFILSVCNTRILSKLWITDSLAERYYSGPYPRDRELLFRTTGGHVPSIAYARSHFLAFANIHHICM